jgi:hypothetical protein
MPKYNLVFYPVAPVLFHASMDATGILMQGVDRWFPGFELQLA